MPTTKNKACTAPDTSAVPTAGEIVEMLPQAESSSYHEPESTQRCFHSTTNTIENYGSKALNEDNGRLHVANEGGAGEGRVSFSGRQRYS